MGFVCVSVDAVRRFEHRGGTFMLGVLPKDVYARCLEQGKGRGMYDLLYMAAQHGVRGHEDLQFEDGKPVQFKTEKDAKGRDVVSEETMGIYHATGLVVALGNELLVPGSQRRAQEALAAAGATGD